MASDERVIGNCVLEPAQVVIDQQDVFFKDNASGQGDPPLIAFNASSGNGEPFMQGTWAANEFPDKCCGGIENGMSTY